MSDIWQVCCRRCKATRRPGLIERIDWLRSLGMLRQEARPEVALVDELFRAAQGRLVCADCGETGLLVTPIDEQAEDESWGMSRPCSECGAPIPAERLELFPDTRLCVTCQSRDERGEVHPDAVEYCPRCGSAMQMIPSRTAGITRYVVACPSCRRR